MMQEILKIGLIVKPQGIRGELKVAPLTDDLHRFLQLKNVLIEGENYRVAGAKIAGDTVFVSISGINDRNVAETFRNKFLCVKREDAVELKQGEFFIADIEGSTLIAGETVVGKITEVTRAKTDFFTVKCTDGKVMRFPFLKDLLVSVDVEKGLVTVNEKRLKEVACYED